MSEVTPRYGRTTPPQPTKPIELVRRDVRPSGVLYALRTEAIPTRLVNVVRSIFGALYCVECEAADCLHVAFVRTVDPEPERRCLAECCANRARD